LEPLNPNNITVYPNGANQVFTFSTQLVVDKPPAGKMDFQISASSEGSWVTSIYPTTASFIISGVQSINATLVVPYTAKAGTLNSITIMATSMYMGKSYQLYQDTFITVAVHLELKVVTDPQTSDHNPQVFQLKLANHSNMDLSYRLEVTDPDVLAKRGLHTQLDKDETPKLAPYENFTIKLTVSYDSGATEGRVPIEVKIVAVSPRGDNLTADSALVIMDVNKNSINRSNYIILGGIVIPFVAILAFVVYRANKRSKMRKKALKSKGAANTKAKGPNKKSR
jgi:hypothetical protein